MSQELLSQDDFALARERIRGRVHRTPQLGSTQLGRLCGRRVSFKAELFQKTGSFKVRGVLNKLSRMPDSQRAKGLVSMSAGNHAAALAWGAAVCGTSATIVMPRRAVLSKIEATRGYGGQVHLTDHDLMEEVGKLQAQHGYTLLHPFDDLDVMAGHGTMGLELLEDAPDVDLVLVPIGGGGLIGGVAAAIKQQRPAVRVLGVEPERADAMSRALAAGRPVAIGHPQTVADGLAAPFAGEHTLRHVQHFVDDVLRVEERAIVEALGLLYTRTKLAAEPSGAAALVPLLTGHPAVGDAKHAVVVVSGGNIDPASLRELF